MCHPIRNHNGQIHYSYKNIYYSKFSRVPSTRIHNMHLISNILSTIQILTHKSIFITAASLSPFIWISSFFLGSLNLRFESFFLGGKNYCGTENYENSAGRNFYGSLKLRNFAGISFYDYWINRKNRKSFFLRHFLL